MADIVDLRNSIDRAQASLNKSFGKSDKQEGEDSNRFLSEYTLSKAYKEEASVNDVVKQFLSITKSIKKMRSSYLSTSSFIGDGGKTPRIDSSVSKMESYENTFMRMMGMPSVGYREDGLTNQEIEIQSGENLLVVNQETGVPSSESFEFVRDKILKQREKPKSERKIVINNNIYNISENSSSSNFVSSVSEQETKASIDAIESDLWKFSYLLLPPIQSLEVSRCINEPEKIVAKPFSSSMRKVNNSKARPTLLESIIRIRLDRVSGTSALQGESVGFSSEPTSDDYGMLEALFVLRLRSAISGLASKLYSDIDIIIDSMDKLSRVPDVQVPAPPSKEELRDSLDTGSQVRRAEGDKPEGAVTEEPLTPLESQKLIEDSILFLLGDDSEVLELQNKTHRSSTIHDSHMMSSIIGIVDLPRRRINEKIKEISQSRDDSAAITTEQKMQEIGVTLGTDVGVGTLDVAVFALALFAMPEESLLGLLSDAQFERIKNGEFKSLLPDGLEKIDSVVAINQLSQLIIDGYNLFISDLESGNP